MRSVMTLVVLALVIGLATLGCRAYLNPKSPFFPPEGSVAHETQYTLGVVEVDDQGWFRSREQPRRVLDEIAKEAQGTRSIIVVFIHGWHHDARPEDDDLACFRATLARLDQEVNLPYFTAARKIFREEGPLRVIGIYVGWRGRSLPGFLDYATFWDRKAAGHRAGDSDLREFLQRLGTLHSDLNRPGHFTGLVTIAHSFGGAVVENALWQVLSRDLIAVVPTTGSADLRSSGQVIRGFGDLVVLINPAFEASLYNNIAELSRRVVYSSEQTPILMTLSAENDGPRRTLFPLGRFFSTLRQGTVSRDQRRQIRTALGVYCPQITHDLKFKGPLPKEKEKPAKGLCKADLSLQPDEAPELKAGDVGAFRQGGDNETLKRFLTQLEMAGHREIYGSVLEPRQGIDHNSAFLVVKASKDIIDGHSGFFNRRLINFLVGYVGQAEAKALGLRLLKARP